jgi:hypothetical protein
LAAAPRQAKRFDGLQQLHLTNLLLSHMFFCASRCGLPGLQARGRA